MKVSIIIPVWNGAKYLAEAIESALGQDYPDIEIIVINDGSSDNSQEVIDTYQHRIVAIYQENKGLGGSRNTGVRASTGDYLAFLDQDDLWAKTKLSAQMNEMLANKNEDPLIFSQAEQFICPTLPPEERHKILLSQPILPGYVAGTLLISKKRFLQIGYFFEEKMIGEFLEWYLRATELKAPIHLLNQVTFYRRIHLSNMGRQPALFHRSDFLKILKQSLDRRRLEVAQLSDHVVG